MRRLDPDRKFPGVEEGEREKMFVARGGQDVWPETVSSGVEARVCSV